MSLKNGKSPLADLAMRTKRFLLGLGWGYVLFAGAWLGLRLLFFDRLWWVALINYIGIYWFIPLPILIAFALGLRYWRLLLGLVIPVLAFLGLYGAFFLPSLRQGEETLTIMSFNVWDSNSDKQAIARSIRIADSDIVGLQEIDSETIAALVQELLAEYSYQALMSPNPSQLDGVAILSRFPIEETVTFALPGDRSGVRAAIRVNETRVQVASVDGIHNPSLSAPLGEMGAIATQHYAQKSDEVELIQQELQQTGDPFLLLCDCNLVDTSQAYQQFSRFAQDSFREAGWGFGHTKLVQIGIFSAAVGQRLDFIWHSDQWRTIATTVQPDSGGSDHLLVVAKLRLR